MASGVARITLPVPFGPRHAHAYLLDDGDGFTLVDTGVATPEAAQALDEALLEAGARPGTVRRVILTHYHVDHAGQAARLAASGAEVSLHAADVPLLETLGEAPAARLAPLLALLERLGMTEAERRSAADGVRSLRRLARPAPVARALADGDRLDAGGRTWTVVALPGHTPGHIALLDGGGLLLGGDLLLGAGPPYAALQADGDPDPVATTLASLDRLARLAPRRCLPGHGEPIEDVPRSARAAAAALRAACDEAETVLGPEPESPYAILSRHDPRHMPAFHRQAALLAFAARLARLAAEGRAEAVTRERTLCYRATARR